MNREAEAQVRKGHCWKRIGIAGDRTCPELAKLGHCQNCPVYAETGAGMLDREPPEGYLEMWATMLAREKEIEVRGTMSVAVFRIGKEWLALAAEVFEEATEMRCVHSIPHRSSNTVQGLVSVRGELQLCVSLANLLGLEKEAEPSDGARHTAYERMVVIERNHERWVFPVDELHGIHRVHADDMRNVPATVANGKEAYTRGIFEWEGHSVGYLDEELLFNSLRRSVT